MKLTQKGFTLVELLVVIGIIALLSAISLPVLSRTRESAAMTQSVSNVREMTSATLGWTVENGGFIPSPQYPGGHGDTNNGNVPEDWDFTETGSGLWLDGVIYSAAYPDGGNRGLGSGQGAHLQDTVFANLQSFRKDPSNQNWYEHSYAMNQDIVPDPIFSQSGSPELTNKSLSRLRHRAGTMLFIENSTSNIVDRGDLADIEATGENRWRTNRVIVGYLDGSVTPLRTADIPSGSDRESDRFWNGADSTDETSR